jgi:YVTN family beta-propeller protein
MFTRRNWLRFAVMPAAAGLGYAGLAGCGRKRSPRYQGYALIASRESQTLAVIDLSRFQRLKEISLDGAPSWVIAAPERNRAFILGAGSPSLEMLNLDTMLLERRIALNGKPRAAKRSQNGERLWVLLEEPHALAAFDSGSGALLTRVALPAAAADLDEYAGAVAIAFHDERRVGIHRPGGTPFQISARLDAAPALIRIRGDGKVFLTGNSEDRSMTAVDGATLQPMVTLPLGLAPRNFCFNIDGGQLFVTGEGVDAVVIVSPYETEVNETILAGKAPGGMAVTSSNPSFLLVTNPESGDVTVINIDNRRVLAQIPVGLGPAAVLVTPDNEYALVLNEQSGDVAVIRLMNIRAASPESRRNRMASIFTLIPVGSGPVSGVVMPRVL